MGVIRAGDFKNGLTFEMNGEPCQIINFQHVKPGKGAAFVRTKFKNLITGAVIEKAFNPADSFNEAYIDRRDMQYTYGEGNQKFFMDIKTYEIVSISDGLIGDKVKFLKENLEVKVLYFKDKIIGVEFPNYVELKVTETEPGVKGNTATNVTKSATLETGSEIKVPLFILPGEKIRIDVRTGEYVERAKK